MELLTGLPWWIKTGWVVLAAWTAVQAIWYRRLWGTECVSATHDAEPSPRPPVSQPAPATVLPTGGTPEFLAELGLLDGDDAAARSAYR